MPHLTPGSPGQLLTAKYAAEAAISVGDLDYAMSLISPIIAANPDDWQALSLRARIAAETGQRDQRDADLAHIVKLHKADPTSQLGRLQQILLETIPLDKGSVRVWYSLEPWGAFNTYLFCRVYDEHGQQVLRLTLETDNFDQPLFAKEHPDLAAKGMRRFSIDGYGNDVKNANGSTTQMHIGYGLFFDGQPSYDTAREHIIRLAASNTSAVSKPTTPVP